MDIPNSGIVSVVSGNLFCRIAWVTILVAIARGRFQIYSGMHPKVQGGDVLWN